VRPVCGSRQIVVIAGRGAVGLTTAYYLASMGWDVEVWSMPDRQPSSYAACALFLPYFGTALSSRMDEWARASWDRFSLIGAEVSSGVRPIRMMEMHREHNAAPEVLRKLTAVRTYQRNDLPRDFSYVWDFKTWLIDIPIYMTYLERLCGEIGVQFRDRMCTPESVSAAHVAAIVDCTGHWSAYEFGSRDIAPVRGQAILLPRAPLEFALGGDEFILAPRQDGILFGSLWQVGETDGRATVFDTRRLLDELRTWSRSPLLRHARLRVDPADVLVVLAGVRPYSEDGSFVRLGSTSRGRVPVVHNTGHGGSGVALSWGVAAEVHATLVGAICA
jgi:D-amino-acid oxidase